MNRQLRHSTRLEIINSQLDFLSVMRSFLPELKRCGSSYRCKSPFQKEKTPSFFVNNKKHIWRCFSSGNSGNSIVSFVQKKYDMTFVQALEYVEVRFGLRSKSRDIKSMAMIIDALKQKHELKTFDFSRNRLQKIYNDIMIKMIKKIVSSCDDRCHILDEYIVYIWSEFDDVMFISFNDFRAFLVWSYRLLRHVKNTTIKSLSYI